MIRRTVSAIAVAAALVAPFAGPSNAKASIFGHSDNNAVNGQSAPKGKMIKLTLKNKTASPMTVYVNNQPVTLAANGEQAVKAAEGSDVLDADHTTVRLHVTPELSGNAVSFR